MVEIPVQAGEKHFKYEQKVKLVNPKLYGRGYAIGAVSYTHLDVYKRQILPFTIGGIAGTSRTARIRNHNQKTYQI